MQVLDGFNKALDGVATMVNGFNPGVTTMDTGKNKEIASGLLASGFTPEDVIALVKVDVSQLEAFLAVEAEVQARLILATKKPVSRTKQTVKV